MWTLQTLGCLLAISLPWVTQIADDNAPLRALPGVAVVGEATAPEIKPYGVDDDWLGAHATRVLAKAGVPLLTRPDAFSSEHQPVLAVRLQTVRLPGTQTFAWHLSVALYRRMATLGAQPDTALSQIWAATGTLGVSSGPLLKSSVRQTLDEKLREFAKAWDSGRR
jgi:hypothetical protein